MPVLRPTGSSTQFAPGQALVLPDVGQPRTAYAVRAVPVLTALDTGFEGAATDGFDALTGTGGSIVTSPVWDGSQALELLTTGAASFHQLTLSKSVLVGRLYLRIHADTSGTASIIQGPNPNGDMQIQLRTGRMLRVQAGAGIGVNSSVLNLDQWYRIDFAFDTSASPALARFQIDGVDQPSASNVQAPANMSAFRLGNTGANTYDVYVDDLTVVDNLTAYPLGPTTPSGATQQGAMSATGTGAMTIDGTLIRQGAASMTGTGAMASDATAIRSGALSATGTGAMASDATAIRSGAASMTGTGLMAATGGVILQGSLSATGTGAMSTTGTAIRGGAASMTGTGATSITGTMIRGGSVSMTGVGTMSVGAGGLVLGTVSMTGTGAFAAAGSRLVSGAIAASGAGTMAAAGQLVLQGSLAATGTGSMTAAGGIRTSGALSLTGTGAMGTTGGLLRSGAASMTGTGLVNAAAIAIRGGSAAWTGTASMTAAPTRLVSSSATWVGAGSALIDGRLRLAGAIAWTGTGALAADGAVVAHYSPFGPRIHARVVQRSITATVRRSSSPVRQSSETAEVRKA